MYRGNLTSAVSASQAHSTCGCVLWYNPATMAYPIKRRLDVLFISGREPSYLRNQVLRRALAWRHCLYTATDDVQPASWRCTKALVKATWRLGRSPDVVLVGFYGQPLMPAMHVLTRRPTILDAFVSTYDTLCFDRQRFRPNSIAGRLAFYLDLWSCRWADLILVDTEANSDYFVQTFGVPKERTAVVHVGCDETQFSPRQAAPSGGRFHVFTHSSFLRLHGIEHILHAAKRLEREAGITFTIAGAGAGLVAIQRTAQELGLDNVRLPGWLPHEQLPEHIAQADLCLGGHFSDVPKAGRHIATKTFQFLAMGKPTIVGDTAANREAMEHRESAFLCPVADPKALAEAILELKEDPALCRHLGEGGRALYLQRFTTEAIALELQAALETLLP